LTHSEQTDDQVTFWVSLRNRNKFYDLKKHTHAHKFVPTLYCHEFLLFLKIG